MHPHLGIAHVQAAVVGIVVVPKEDLLGPKAHAIGGGAGYLVRLTSLHHVTPIHGAVGGSRFDDVAGIVSPQHVASIGRGAALNNGATGIDAVFVFVHAWLYGNALIAPPNEVVRSKLPPSLLVGMRPGVVVLIEEAIGSSELAESVGVVEPMLRRPKVEAYVPSVMGHGRISFLHRGLGANNMRIECSVQDECLERSIVVAAMAIS